MSKKKSPLTHSQMLGIIWLSIALLLIAGIAFFSRKHATEEVNKGTVNTTDTLILAIKEDSVYSTRSKYKNHNKLHHKSQYNYAHQLKSYTKDTTKHALATPPRRQPLKVELNTADSLTLQLLHGIGPTYARRIVRYRERLGGFTQPEQLLEVYGFSKELLDHIMPYLTLDTTQIHPIAINNIELKQLARHPYIEYYQARDIIRLHEKGIVFHNADDLRAVPSMADSTLQRLLPYISFDN